jgi:hypothetical protein
MDTPHTPLIYKQLNAVMLAVGNIGKDAKNDHFGYHYRSAEAVVNRISPLLALNGIVVVPQVLDEFRENGKTKKGEENHFISLKVKYTFFASDGSSVEVITMGECADTSDRQAAKAQTHAFKTALTTLFAIATQPEDDPDKHAQPWAVEARGGITLADLNGLKREFAKHRASDLAGKSKQDQSLVFQDFVWNTTGEAFAVTDWQAWTHEQLEACLIALNTTKEAVT